MQLDVSLALFWTESSAAKLTSHVPELYIKVAAVGTWAATVRWLFWRPTYTFCAVERADSFRCNLFKSDHYSFFHNCLGYRLYDTAKKLWFGAPQQKLYETIIFIRQVSKCSGFRMLVCSKRVRNFRSCSLQQICWQQLCLTYAQNT